MVAPGTSGSFPCSKGTNFSSRFGYSWYCSTTRDMRAHRLAPSCPSSSPPPLTPLGTPLPSLQHTKEQYNPSLSHCPAITGSGFHTIRVSCPPQSPPESRAGTASQRGSHVACQIARHILASPGTWPHALQPTAGCWFCMERGQRGRSGHRSTSQLCFIMGTAQTIPGPWPEGGQRDMMATALHHCSHRAPAPRCAWVSLYTCLLTPGGEDLHGGKCMSGEGWGPERGDSGPEAITWLPADPAPS